MLFIGNLNHVPGNKHTPNHVIHIVKTKPKYGHLIKWIFSLIDLVALNGSYLAVLLLNSSMHVSIRLVWLLLNVSYLVVVYFRRDIHDRRVLYADHVVLQALKSVALHAGIFLAAVEFLGIMLPLNGLAMLYAFFAISLSLWWIVSRKLIKVYRNHGFNYRNILIVGNGSVTNRFIEEINSDLGYGYHILGLFGCNKEILPEVLHGNVDDIEDFVENNPVDEIYCAVPDSDDKHLSSLIRLAENHAIDFYYLPQLGPTVTRKFSLLTFGNVPVMSVMPHPGQSTFNRAVKRAFDILLSSIALLLSPIVVIPVVIAIKLTSKGPVIFKQERTGYRGKVFNCYKFRTMSYNPQREVRQVTRDDNDVTRVGRFLRHYSIDELPQFFNVLKGDMSIVGPRPHMVQHTEQYRQLIDKYMLRHIIKPGITGWAQVLGYRGETNELWKMEKRVECDVWYAENWNLMLDLKIILLTIYKTIKGDNNAY